jgi:prepilin-type N-terminal cleavage/methylation domain-containing protein
MERCHESGRSRVVVDRGRSRRGFTLVELLVVIAIIGILVALLLPAVQAAREAARRTTCQNQIKQLALGAINHHDTHKHFPTGGWGWFWVGDPDRGYGKDQPGGWIYNTLTYMEQGALHDMGSDGDPAVATRDQRTGASYVLQTPIDFMNCPTRRASRTYPMGSNEAGGGGYKNALTPDVAGRSDYAMCSGIGYTEGGAGPSSYTDTGYGWIVNNKLIKQHLVGISFERSEVGMRRISDGTSNTYMLGEKYIPVAHYETGEFGGDNETWCTGFNNDNYRVSARLQGNTPTGAIIECTPIQDSDTGVAESERRFGSSHAAVWLMAYCDGSVHAMSFDIDWQAHRDLGNREDGNVIDASKL